MQTFKHFKLKKIISKKCLLLTCILIIGMIFFLISAIIASQSHYFEFLGPGILFSWGSAAAILALNFIGTMFVAYSFITFCRWICKTRCAYLIDQKIFIHELWGYLILIFSWIHTIGHLTGLFIKIPKSTIYEINYNLMHKNFEKVPSYH